MTAEPRDPDYPEPHEIADDLVEELSLAATERSADWSLRVDTANECAWSAEVRVTRYPGSAGPDHSDLFYVVGQESPSEAIIGAVGAALDLVRAWEEPK